MKHENKITVKCRGWQMESVIGGMGYKIENVWRWMCLVDYIEEDFVVVYIEEDYVDELKEYYYIEYVH